MNENLSKEEQREIFKKLKKYQVSKEWKDILKAYKEEGDEILEEIKEELDGRGKVELFFSELDKLNVYINIVKRLKEIVSNKFFKEYLEKNEEIQNTYLYVKVEVGFDAPLYSRLDILKQEKNIMLTINELLDKVINDYDEVKTDKEKQDEEKTREDIDKEANPY